LTAKEPRTKRTILFQSDDAKEGINAFLNKRKPKWKNK